MISDRREIILDFSRNLCYFVTVCRTMGSEVHESATVVGE